MSDIAPQIVVVGSHAPGIFVRVKRAPAVGETVIGWDFQEPEDGGKGSNQAIAAARLGAEVSFVGCLGTDRLGAEGERLLQKEGVDVRHISHCFTKNTGTGIIMLDEKGVPTMVTYMGANEELSCAQVEEALAELRSAKVMLTQFEILTEVALYAAQVARRYNMTTILNPAPAPPISLSELEVADVLVPNEFEAKTLLGEDPKAQIDLELVAQELFTSTKAGMVIITAGDQGIIGMDSNGIWRAQSPDVSVVDTSGAGDVFCAALAVGLTKGLNRRSASVWACTAAALSVSKKGTIPSFPTASEIDSFNTKQIM
jgi:ribokinase